MNSGRSFEGLTGRLSASIMARVNSDTEATAVAHLAPTASADVLVIGFGPGEGLHLLAEIIPEGQIAGIDLSQVMLDHARRRNREACDSGLIDLRLGRADALPWPDRSFDGIIAVNSIQLWDPFRDSVAEVARVLRPDGRFVSFTHEWAIRRSTHMGVEEWLRRAETIFAECDLGRTRSWQAASRSGTSIGLTAHRP